MTKLLTGAFVTTALIGLAGAASAQTPQVQEGQKVYAAQKCSICHSIAGVGNKKGELDHVGAKLSAADLRAWIVDAEGMTAKTNAARKPAMKSYPKLEKGEVDALVAYMQSLK